MQAGLAYVQNNLILILISKLNSRIEKRTTLTLVYILQ